MKPEAEGRTGKENAEILVKRLKALKSVIPCVVSLDAGLDYRHLDSSYDVGLCTVFKTKEDLITYQDHPAHVPVAKWSRTEIAESVAMADFEV
jgi:hypothetical protein